MSMLISRLGEKVMIGDDIEVTVLASDGRQIRIWVDAPRDISVCREDQYRRLQKAKSGGGE